MNGNRRPTGQSPLNDANHPLHLRPNPNSLARVATMVLSGLTMLLTLGGAGQLLLQILDVGVMNVGLASLAIQLVIYAFTLVVSLGIASMGARAGNVMIPVTFDVYKWVVTLALGYLYYEIIRRFFLQLYDIPRYIVYLVVLIGGLFLLWVLNRFSETKNLGPHAGIILAMCMVHLLVIFGHYVIDKNDKLDFFAAEFVMLLAMIVGAILMVRTDALPGLPFGGNNRKRVVWRGNQPPPQGG